MFYMVIIKEDSQAVYKHDTVNAAKAAQHTELAYAYTTGAKCTAMVLDKFGNVLTRETTFTEE